MRIVFVDGYNVLNCWPELRDIISYDIDAARKRLIEIMQNYSSYKEYKVIIVYDAYSCKESVQKKDKIGANLEVVFTKEGETADSYIERTVACIGRKYEVFVVTSDNLEQQLIFGRGAVRVPSMEFYFEVKEIEKIISTKVTKKSSNNKSPLSDRISKDIFDKLDEMRKSK